MGDLQEQTARAAMAQPRVITSDPGVQVEQEPVRARVGDRIEHGQPIPGNVVRFDDAQGYDRHARGRGLAAKIAAGTMLTEWFPLTVTEVDPCGHCASTTYWLCPDHEVDPEPQPAERRLIGPPHAHLDAPCTDACYETEPQPERDVEDDVHYYVSELRPGVTFCGIGLEEDNELETTDEPGKATCDTCRAEADEDAAGARDPEPQPTASPYGDPGAFAECVAWLIDAGLGTPADRRIDRMAAQHQELQARYDTVVSDRETVRASLELVKQRIPEAKDAAPGPSQHVVLRLPEVPEGDAPDDLDRFLAEQMRDPEFAAAFEDAGVRPRLILRLVALRKALGLTVEQVAERMQTKPKRVRQYEGGLTDATLSMHQRYARAVSARIAVEVIEP